MCSKDEAEPFDRTRRALLAGSVGAALAGLAPGGAFAQGAGAAAQPPTRVLDDPRVRHGPVFFTHDGRRTIDGYLARPKAEGVYPAVIVVAGNRITEEYIPNTCAALALAGFVGLAPNVFHILPDSAVTIAEMQAASARHTDDDNVEDVRQALDYLRLQPFVRKRGIGVVGFCHGGRIALLFGSRSTEVDAVTAFHPSAVAAAELKRLRCPVQIHYGTGDASVPRSVIDAIVAALRNQATPVELFLYEGAQHGFLAYTRPPRYDPVAGAAAWARTTAFLHKQLA